MDSHYKDKTVRKLGACKAVSLYWNSCTGYVVIWKMAVLWLQMPWFHVDAINLEIPFQIIYCPFGFFASSGAGGGVGVGWMGVYGMGVISIACWWFGYIKNGFYSRKEGFYIETGLQLGAHKSSYGGSALVEAWQPIRYAPLHLVHAFSKHAINCVCTVYLIVQGTFYVYAWPMRDDVTL